MEMGRRETVRDEVNLAIRALQVTVHVNFMRGEMERQIHKAEAHLENAKNALEGMKR